MIAIDVARLLNQRLRQADAARVPAIAEHRADGVRAFAHERRHVIRLILCARGIVGEFRRKQVIADALAIDVQLIHAERRCVDDGSLRLDRKRELAPQHRCRYVINRRRFVADPPRRPITDIHQSHHPARRLAPARWLVALIPEANFPEALLARRERLALIEDLNRLARCDLASVPEVAFVGGKKGGAAGDKNLIRRLFRAARVAFNHPAQARLARLNRERRDQVLAAQRRGEYAAAALCKRGQRRRGQ